MNSDYFPYTAYTVLGDGIIAVFWQFIKKIGDKNDFTKVKV